MRKQKAFIQIPILIIAIMVIVASAVGAGVVLHKQGKLSSITANISGVFGQNKEITIIKDKELKEEKPLMEQEPKKESESESSLKITIPEFNKPKSITRIETEEKVTEPEFIPEVKEPEIVPEIEEPKTISIVEKAEVCTNCNISDGCSGDSYLDYYCSSNSCIYNSDNCSDCSCSCGGYNTEESVANGNCSDGKDNDCDGDTDSVDSGCFNNTEILTPLIISNVKSLGIWPDSISKNAYVPVIFLEPKDESTIVSWITNKDTVNNLIEYSSDYLSSGQLNTASDASSGTIHKIKLVNLEYNTTYYYRVSSIDKNGDKVVSDEFNFTTAQPGLTENDIEYDFNPKIIDKENSPTNNKVAFVLKTNKKDFDVSQISVLYWNFYDESKNISVSFSGSAEHLSSNEVVLYFSIDYNDDYSFQLKDIKYGINYQGYPIGSLSEKIDITNGKILTISGAK